MKILPRWQCKKTVEGFKIGKIEPIDSGGAELTSDCGNYIVRTGQSYVTKHRPQVGGFYVRYRGGYESWSPNEDFVDGYDLLPD